MACLGPQGREGGRQAGAAAGLELYSSEGLIIINLKPLDLLTASLYYYKKEAGGGQVERLF